MVTEDLVTMVIHRTVTIGPRYQGYTGSMITHDLYSMVTQDLVTMVTLDLVAMVISNRIAKKDVVTMVPQLL